MRKEISHERKGNKKNVFEERTKTYHHTLCEAKKAHRFSYILRVWLKDKTIIGKETVYAYGSSCCTIKRADEYIAEKIK